MPCHPVTTPVTTHPGSTPRSSARSTRRTARRSRRTSSRARSSAARRCKLAHPNVVAVHDVGDAGGDVFVAMEHVDGVTLAAWLERARIPAEIMGVFAQAGRGLAAAHAVGLVHRDVKP
ncbi:MAG: hypothetical protein H0T79_07120, partial [Deltaproteobacteria bacterium]|nr:hypothetical protein [Deltaproteobacteria bacterium]